MDWKSDDKKTELAAMEQLARNLFSTFLIISHSPKKGQYIKWMMQPKKDDIENHMKLYQYKRYTEAMKT